MTDETSTLNSLPTNPIYATVNRNALIQDDEPPPPTYLAVSTSLINSQSETPATTNSSLPVQTTPITQRPAPPIPVQQSKNPFNEDVRRSVVPPAPAANSFPAEIAARISAAPVNVIEQRPKPFWESGDSSVDEWHRSQSQEYYGEGEEAQVEYADGTYDETEYYEQEPITKKKGFFKKLLRSVKRISTGGSAHRHEDHAFSSTAEAHGHHSAHSEPRELTADELALHDRYSNPLHCRFISLEQTDHTLPSDVRIHDAMNRIYLSDTGRSIIEIFDMNGQVLHAISDPAMLKFQPNRFALTPDGTLIISSAVMQCLYMYSPASPFSENFQYQQFKLGAEGKLIHQFCSPSDMVTDPANGYVYVCDVGNYRIKVLTPQGMCERVILVAHFVAGVKQYLYPTAITYQPSRGQLVCIVNNEDAICFISKHANGRTYVEPIWITDENGVGLRGASSLAVDSQDRIFISDGLNHRVVICTVEGQYITSFGTHGTGLAQLDTPRGLDIASDGSVVIAELGNRRLQIFGSVRSQPPPSPPPSLPAPFAILSNNGNPSESLLVETNDDLTAVL